MKKTLESYNYIKELKKCKNKNDFQNIWNENEFNWNYYSTNLAIELSHFFPIWWNPIKFNWIHSQILSSWCCDYFKTWWNSEKYNWKDGSCSLAIHCAEHFLIWYNEYLFNWKSANLLNIGCQKYIEIWRHKYVMEKLKGTFK